MDSASSGSPRDLIRYTPVRHSRVHAPGFEWETIRDDASAWIGYSKSRRRVLKIHRERRWLLWRNLLRLSPAEREAKALVRLLERDLPVPALVRVETTRRCGFYATSSLEMEFLPGTRPLSDLMGERPASWPRELMPILGRLVSAMHQGRVYHGHLTPKNILVGPPGRDGHRGVHLIDLECAVCFDGELPRIARRLDLAHFLRRARFSRIDRLRFLRQYEVRSCMPLRQTTRAGLIYGNSTYIAARWRRISRQALAIFSLTQRLRSART